MWIKLGITHLKFWQEIQKNSFLMEDTIMSCRYVIYEIKSRYFEKATKFEPIFHFFDVFDIVASNIK